MEEELITDSCLIEKHSVTIGEIEQECETCQFLDDGPLLEQFLQKSGQVALGLLLLIKDKENEKFGFRGVLKDKDQEDMSSLIGMRD